MSVDQPTAAFLGQMASSGARPLQELTAAEARGLGRMLQDLYGQGPEMVEIRDVHVPSGEGPVPVRVLVPAAHPRGTIVYFHGGGWVLGTLDESETLGRQLAARTSCTVVLVDYRLAPEHPYPAAVQDAHVAVAWAAEHSDQLAAPGAPLIVMGDSAGGNLAAVVAQAAGRSGPPVSLQVLIYPITDCDLSTASYVDPDNQLFLTRDGMAWFWDHYAPDRDARTAPELSPLRAPDLAGLPPAVVLTAEHDVLRDEGEAYAEHLRQAGVAVNSRRFAGQMHMFFTLVNVLPGAAVGMDYVADQIDRHLSTATTSSATKPTAGVTT